MHFDARAILFDMDGVLVSSIGGVERSWRKWAAHYELPDPANYNVPHGLRAADIVRMLKPDLDVQEGLQLIEELELDDMGDLRELPGARQLLSALPSKRWAVVSSATRRVLFSRLQQARLPLPELLVTAEMVTRGKPDPEPYRRGAELLHAPPSECLVIEDAPSGVRAGVAAGCAVLGVEGTHRREELLEAGARWVVASLEAVSANVQGEYIQLRAQV